MEAREHLLELRRQLLNTPESRDSELAAVKLDELQQCFWRIGIIARSTDISNAHTSIQSENVLDRAINALMEFGGNRKEAKLLVDHLVKRGVIKP